MADQTKNAPVASMRDGAVQANVWRNISREGDVFYNTTFGRSYKKENGDYAETSSFGPNDLLKIEKLASEAYRTIQWNRQQDREAAREAAQDSVDMASERDAAMGKAPPRNRKDEGRQSQTRHYDQPEP